MSHLEFSLGLHYSYINGTWRWPPHPLLVPWSRKSRAIPLLPPMGRTACTEPQCLYKGALYFYFYSILKHRMIHEEQRLTYKHVGDLLTFGKHIGCVWGWLDTLTVVQCTVLTLLKNVQCIYSSTQSAIYIYICIYVRKSTDITYVTYMHAILRKTEQTLCTWLIYGAESFLRRFSASQEMPRIFPELEGSLPHSQEPATSPYPEPAQSSPYPHIPTYWRYILILTSHLRLGLPSCLFPSGFPTKTLYTPLVYPIRASAPPIHSSRFGHPNNVWWRLEIIKLLNMWSTPLLCYLAPLRPKYYFQHPILKTTSAYDPPSILVRDQVSHPYKTTYKIVVLCILIFIFLEKLRQNILHRMIASIPRLQSAFNLFLNRILYR